MTYMTERRELIVLALGDGPAFVRDLADQLGITVTQAYKSIYDLEADGVVRRTTDFPAKCYLVNGSRNARVEPAVGDDVSERTPHWPDTAVTVRRHQGMAVLCSSCQTTREFDRRLPASKVRTDIERNGWSVDKKWKTARCPGCADKVGPSPVPAVPVIARGAGPDPKIMRLVFSLLEEHYDPETHQYDTGWTDERIAKDADCSVAFVAETREQGFGPLEDPRIADLRGLIAETRLSIDKARAAAKTEADELRVLVRDSEARWSETLAGLTKQLDDAGRRLAQLTGPK